MSSEKAGGYISKIHFNDGTDVDIQQNDIVIFVGPNNAGKSQSLKDIYTLASEKQQTTVVTDITIKKSSTNIKDLLDSIAPKEFQGSLTLYNVLGHTFYYNKDTDDLFLSKPYFNVF